MHLEVKEHGRIGEQEDPEYGYQFNRLWRFLMPQYNNNSCIVTILPGETVVENDQDQSTYRPAGYAALIERYDLDVIPNWHKSLVTDSGIHRIDSSGVVIKEVYPSKYWPGDTLGDHLESNSRSSMMGRIFPSSASCFRRQGRKISLNISDPNRPANMPGACGSCTSS